jgi:hypothetical protein
VLKIRLMGTKNDIKWFERLLRRQHKVAVTEVSDVSSITKHSDKADTKP